MFEDLAGNAWEWCASVYDEDLGSTQRAKQPRPRVLRGGSWVGGSGQRALRRPPRVQPGLPAGPPHRFSVLRVSSPIVES